MLFILKEDIEELFENIDIYLDDALVNIQEFHEDILVDMAIIEESVLMEVENKANIDNKKLLKDIEAQNKKVSKIKNTKDNAEELATENKKLFELLSKLNSVAKNKEDKHLSKDMRDLKSVTLDIVKDLGYDIDKRLENYYPGEKKQAGKLLEFLKKIWLWLKNTVFSIFSSIANALKSLLGFKSDNLFENIEDYDKSLDLLENSDYMTVTELGRIKLYEEKPSLIVEAGFFKEKEPKAKYMVIDVSKEVFELNVAIDHFFKLFENAFGTHGEYLYDTDDLKSLLQIIKLSIKNLKAGNLFPIDDEDGYVTLEKTISIDRIKESLKSTKVNTDKLRAAYLSTTKIIQMLLETIATKQAQTTTSLASMALFNKMTQKQLLELASKMKPKMKQAVALYKKMEGMIVKFKKLSKDISEEQFNIQKYAAVTYVTPDMQLIKNYFQMVRMLIQITDLRMSALAIYIKEMRDIQGAMVMFSGGASLDDEKKKKLGLFSRA